MTRQQFRAPEPVYLPGIGFALFPGRSSEGGDTCEPKCSEPSVSAPDSSPSSSQEAQESATSDGRAGRDLRTGSRPVTGSRTITGDDDEQRVTR